MATNITANKITAKDIESDKIKAKEMKSDSAEIGGASISGKTIVVDKIILGGWTIFAQGEKLFAKTPAGVDVQFEMIDYKLILGEQPTTPPDYVSPTLSSTSQGYNEAGTPANSAPIA